MKKEKDAGKPKFAEVTFKKYLLGIHKQTVSVFFSLSFFISETKVLFLLQFWSLVLLMYFLQLHQFPGYDPNKLTPLPGHLTSEEILNVVVQASVRIDKMVSWRLTRHLKQKLF